MSNALAIRPDQTEWTEEQSAAFKAMGVHAPTAAAATVFLSYCQTTGLDPFRKQIMLFKDGSPYVQIDGLRLIATRTGEWDGQEGPQWAGPDGQWLDVWTATEPPTAARVGIYRKGTTRPVWGVVLWREFGAPKATTKSWREMPSHMLAKVAESHALRKAFPAEMSGLYTSDEMAQSQRPTPAAPVVSVAHLVPESHDIVDEATGELIPLEDTVDAEVMEPGE